MKKALATIDCVVVGVEVGHGKRHGVLVGLHVRGPRRGERAAGHDRQGVQRPDRRRDRRDDAWFEEHTISDHGRYRLVEPTVVVEVAFDVIMRSTRHKSGFALRFPRIAAPAPRQAGRRDRHARDGDPPVRGPPARRRAPRDGERAARTDHRMLRDDGARGRTPRRRGEHVLDVPGRPGRARAVHRRAHHARDAPDAPAPGHRHPQPGRRAVPRPRGRHGRGVRQPRRRRRGPSSRRSTSTRSCSRSPRRRAGDARAADAEAGPSRRSSRSRRSRSPARSTCCRPRRPARRRSSELTGRFLPVTEATYWSDPLAEPASRRR